MKTLLLIIAIAAVVLIILARTGAVGKKVALYVILLMIAFIMLLPFYMMFVMSTLKTNEIYSFPPILTFGTNLAENFKNMTASVNLPRAFLNLLWQKSITSAGIRSRRSFLCWKMTPM